MSFMAKDSVKIRLKPQQGKTYTVTSKANMTTSMKVQGQTMNMSQVMETRQTFTPTEVSDDQSVIETQIEAIKMTLSQMGMKFEYDSEHPENTSPMIAGQTKEIEKSLKTTTTITYDALGQIVGDGDLTNPLRDVILQLPEEELSVGSKWSSNKSQTVSDVEVIANMEYTVTAINKKSIEVSFTGNVEASLVSGSYEGTGTIDPKTGILVSSTTNTSISMTVDAEDISIPMDMEATTTVTVK